jgi:hypothetical protein
MSLVVDEHREYLADAPRIAAYRAALSAVVTPGSIGLDLASGTGILGLLACQAGAARIYALESGDIAGLAQQLAVENGFGDRITTIQEWSTRAELPERVDFVVTDLAGRFGFEAGLFELLDDARRRFLKPGGAIIPSAVTLWIAPVTCVEARGHVDFWTRPLHGLTFGAAHSIAKSTGYPRHLSTADLLAPPVVLASASLQETAETLSGRSEFTIDRAQQLDGIGGWFSATLADGVELTNAPGSAGRINRRNVFFPLRDAVAAQPGDRVTVSMFIRQAQLLVRWHVEVFRGEQRLHATDTSTFSGMLLSPQSKARTLPGFTPRLTPAGLARRTVVDMCDGTHTVEEIERAMLERHPGVVRTAAEAAVFVAEVVSAYGR